MENNEGNIKPQTTGGLKLMTVFIAVLALHVVVIGGFTVYHLLSTSSSDPDLALDKNHKNKALADSSLSNDPSAPTDTASTDKTATTTPPATDTASTSTSTTSPASTTPATTSTPSTTTTTPSSTADSEPPTIITPTTDTPSGPTQHGPVISPPENLAPIADASSTAASPSTAETTPVTDGTPYVVKKGDSLARIAHQHHITLAKLKAANSLSSDMLHIGQKMIIPSRNQAVATSATTTTTPTNSSTPETDTTTTTPTETTAPAPHASHNSVAKTTGGHHLYTVVKGDTLIKIARRFKTTPTAIMTANNMTDAGRLSIGRKLRIPSGESRSAAASAPVPATPSEETESKPHARGQLANYVP